MSERADDGPHTPAVPVDAVWAGDERVRIAETDFVLAPKRIRDVDLAPGELLLRKARWMVERYLALRSEVEAERIVEIGIYEGGGTALLSLLFDPQRIVAVDLSSERVHALDGFIRDRGLEAAVRPYYGVDQGDRARLGEILDDEFGGEALDLVVDDGSHLLLPTTESFNLLFPRLRPGGFFVIEDWSWKHHSERAFVARLRADSVFRRQFAARLESDTRLESDALVRNAFSPVPDREGAGGALAERLETHELPLSRLVLELAMTAGYDEEVVAEVTSLRRGWVAIRRGAAPLDPTTFDVRHAFGQLGRSVLGDR